MYMRYCGIRGNEIAIKANNMTREPKARQGIREDNIWDIHGENKYRRSKIGSEDDLE